MHDYLTKSKKSEGIKRLLNEALDILHNVGVPFSGKTERGLENMALAFLAVAGVKKSWKEAQGQKEYRQITTRDIIKYINQHFEENISAGSYDDIRRKRLKLLVLADLILNSANNPSAAPNDPTRGYTLSNEFKVLVNNYGTDDWAIKLKLFNKNHPSLSEILQRKREMPKVRVKLATGDILDFSRGGHNQLQKEIIEEFLPRFGGKCEILYIGDATDKYLLRKDDKLKTLGFFELTHDSLPDIVAYNSEKNWLFLIEAFFTSGPMSEERILELKKALKHCSAGLIFVTAFTSKTDFKKNVADIGWETEVWTADNPDHLVHFNGSKFLGPYGN